MKQLLKKILPRLLLSNLHQRFNRLRIQTVDKLLFPERHFATAEFKVQRNAHPFEGVPFDLPRLSAKMQQQIKNWQNWTQDEYLLVYEQPCLIEPRAGWALAANNHLIYPSLGFSRVDYLRKPQLESLRMQNQPVDEYPELISLRDTGEENYYHFYNDILAKLFFLEEQLGVSSAVPILVAGSLYRRAYFQYFLQHSYLRTRTWVVQDQQYVRSHKTYFCKPLTHTARYYGRFRELAHPADLIPARTERRIFITRSPKRLRYLENRLEIEQLCRQEGFEVLDFDDMQLPEQIQALAGARYVIGIHGAGLTNILFRGEQPLSLLEIFPPGDYYPFHYMLLAAQLGYAYNGIVGEAAQQQFSVGFYLDPELLRPSIRAMTEQAASNKAASQTETPTSKKPL